MNLYEVKLEIHTLVSTGGYISHVSSPNSLIIHDKKPSIMMTWQFEICIAMLSLTYVNFH